METETYKNAKLILERFDPEAKKKAVSDDICFCFTLCLFSVIFYCIFVFDFYLFSLLSRCRSWSLLQCVLR